MNTIPPAYKRPASESADENFFSLRDLLETVQTKWVYFLLSVLIFGALSWLYLSSRTPLYQRHAVILVKDDATGSTSSKRSALNTTSLMQLNGVLGGTSVKNELYILRSYQLMREVSDRLCREYGLSVIEEPRGRGVRQYLYKMERDGMPTRYNVARQAIDESIELSLTMEEFQAEMKKRGYLLRFDSNRKYWSIVPPGWKKPIRIHKLGDDYTKEMIQERISENDIHIRAIRMRQQYRIPNNYSLKRRVDRIMGRSGLEKLYLRYCYELGYLPKYRQKPAHLHIVLKEDLLKCDQYSEQAKLLSRYHISTEGDLSSHQERVEEKMADISARRDEMRKKIRRVLPETEIAETKEEIVKLTTELRKLRREVKVCEQIRERSAHVKENLTTIDRDRQKQKEQSR